MKTADKKIITRLGVVIVNHRTPALVLRCLESLEGEVAANPGTGVVVVDNDCEPQSAAEIVRAIEERGWGEWARVRPLKRNGGFAFGANRGFENFSAADFLLLLNSDTVVKPGCLAHCLGVMRDDPSIGVMSCLLLNGDGTVQNVARPFPTPLRVLARAWGLPWYFPSLFQWAHPDHPAWDRGREVRDVDWLGGGFLFLRASLFRQLRGFDEEFFLYGEDLEFSHRVWKAGFRCHYDPRVSVVHFGGGSSEAGELGPEDLERHRLRARYLVQKKCYHPLAAFVLRVTDFLVALFRRLWFAAKGRQESARYKSLVRFLDLVTGPLDTPGDFTFSVILSPFRLKAGEKGEESPGQRFFGRPDGLPQNDETRKMQKRRTRLRVLFALPGLHRTRRGAEAAFESLGHEMSRTLGVEVTLAGAGERNGHHAYQFKPTPCLPSSRFQNWPSLPMLRSPYAYEELSFASRLACSYDPGDYDITVACTYPYLNWLFRRGRSARPAHIFVTQNGDWACRTKKSEYQFFSCDGLVCISPGMYERNRGRWPSVFIPNGVDSRLFSPGPSRRSQWGIPEGPLVVLMVSAFTAEKRVLEGMRAAARIPNVYFVAAGEGPLRTRAEREAQKLLKGRFRFLSLTQQELADLYRSADIFLHMNPDEVFGNVYLEAQASGLPIVAPDTPHVRWIAGEHAVFMNPLEPSSIARAILTAQKRKTPAFIQSCRERMERDFSPALAARRYVEFFRQVIEYRSVILSGDKKRGEAPRRISEIPRPNSSQMAGNCDSG